MVLGTMHFLVCASSMWKNNHTAQGSKFWFNLGWDGEMKHKAWTDFFLMVYIRCAILMRRSTLEVSKARCYILNISFHCTNIPH